MKLRRTIFLTGLLTMGWPLLAWAGEQDVKATFLLLGGIGGVLIGAGLYAFLLVLTAVFIQPKAALIGLFALCTAVFLYIQYWSFYFLAIATRFLRLRQMRYEFGTLPPLLHWAAAGVGLWGLLAVGVALRMWLSRRRHRQASLGEF